MNKCYRQGDVILIPVRSIPEDAVRQVVEDRIVLAEGEQTGHSHTVAVEEAEIFTVSDEVDRWLRVKSGGATVTHQEHAPVEVPEGDWIVRIQSEYHPEEIRRVID